MVKMRWYICVLNKIMVRTNCRVQERKCLCTCVYTGCEVGHPNYLSRPGTACKMFQGLPELL
jgi:hypothetical protein